MYLILHRISDNKEILFNLNYLISAESISNGTEIIALSDECFEVKEPYSFIRDCIKGNITEYRFQQTFINNKITEDAISKDIKKKNPKRIYHRHFNKRKQNIQESKTEIKQNEN